jgi:hypothetical protein
MLTSGIQQKTSAMMPHTMEAIAKPFVGSAAGAYG